jgi:hypothetical protein
MSRVLLRELLFAGGGVEAEFLRLCDAVEVAQTEYNVNRPGVSGGSGRCL